MSSIHYKFSASSTFKAGFIKVSSKIARDLKVWKIEKSVFFSLNFVRFRWNYIRLLSSMVFPFHWPIWSVKLWKKKVSSRPRSISPYQTPRIVKSTRMSRRWSPKTHPSLSNVLHSAIVLQDFWMKSWKFFTTSYHIKKNHQLFQKWLIECSVFSLEFKSRKDVFRWNFRTKNIFDF